MMISYTPLTMIPSCAPLLLVACLYVWLITVYFCDIRAQDASPGFPRFRLIGHFRERGVYGIMKIND
jgi:hypothetical protein